MTDRQERQKKMMREIAFGDAHELYERGQHPLQTDNRKSRRQMNKQVKKHLQRLYPVLETISSSGVGYPVDETLRTFVGEYNERALSHGTLLMPNSFAVMEQFLTYFKFENQTPIFKLRPEKDHLFLTEDFFEFATSEDSDKTNQKWPDLLQEGVIYNFTPIRPITDFTFLFDDTTGFAIAGFALIKHGHEVSWLMLGGPELSQSEKENLEQYLAHQGFSPPKTGKKKHLLKDKGFEGDKPLFFENAENVYRHIILGRFDSQSMKHQVKYVFLDNEKHLRVFSDDPDFLNPLEQKEKEENLEIIDNSQIMFNIAETMLKLPEYFNFKYTYVSEEEKETRIADSFKAKQVASKTQEYGTKIKKVSALEIVSNAESAAIRSYSPPNFRVEVDGFWRRLGHESTGKGPNGESVVGRTWVKGHMRWRDRPIKQKIIYLKSSVSAAKSRLKTLEGYENLPGEKDTSAPIGYIYVMRCPLLEEEMFKVGFTTKTPQNRAEELSKSTGVPLSFVVVESWKVNSPKEVEKIVHTALDEYRPNPRREFFKLKFEQMRKIIEDCIQRSPN